MTSHPSPDTQPAVLDGFFPATSMPDMDWWRALWPDPDGVVQALGVVPGMRALDLACGDGYFTAALARRARPGCTVGLDLDPALLAQARAACADLPCDWRLGDAMAIGHSCPGPFDVVLMANTFHGVPDKVALARAVAAVLAPEGRFVIVNWYPRPREETVVLGKSRGPRTELRLSPEATMNAIAAAGFERHLTVPLAPYHYGLILRKPAQRDARDTALAPS